MNGPPKWTVLKGKKLDGPKERNWTVIRNESRRSKRLEVDGPKGSKLTVQKNVPSKEKQLGDQQG